MSIKKNVLQTQLFIAEINRDIWRNSTCVLNEKFNQTQKFEIFENLRVGTLPLPSQVERFYLLSRASKHQDLFAEDPPSFRDLNEDLGYGILDWVKFGLGLGKVKFRLISGQFRAVPSA